MESFGYADNRLQGLKRLAMRWEDIVWEANRAIGERDAQAWLTGVADLLADPFFVRDPVPFEWVAETRVRVKHPHVEGHTWASPHPEAWHKLGYYQIWRPGEPVQDVFGEWGVRLALLENNVCRSKL